jgi:hypothetical protein
MDAATTVQKIVPVFLEGDLERFQINVMSTESTIKDNHVEIVKWLSGKVDQEIIDELKEKLKL